MRLLVLLEWVLNKLYNRLDINYKPCIITPTLTSERTVMPKSSFEINQRLSMFDRWATPTEGTKMKVTTIDMGAFAIDVIKPQPKINAVPYISAGQWELFSDMKGVDNVATNLNKALMDAVNGTNTAEEAQELVRSTMGKWAHYGATDSEPDSLLVEILREVYNRPDLER